MIGLSCCVSLFVGHDASDRFHSSCTNYCLIAHHPRAVIQDVAFVSTSECSVRGGGAYICPGTSLFFNGVSPDRISSLRQTETK